MRRSPFLPPKPSFGAKPTVATVTEVEIEEPEAPVEETGNDEETARITAGYVGPDQHCSTCTHCDEASRCRLYSFTCEPEGGCPDHEPRESSAGLSGLPEPEAQLE